MFEQPRGKFLALSAAAVWLSMGCGGGGTGTLGSQLDPDGDTGGAVADAGDAADRGTALFGPGAAGNASLDGDTWDVDVTLPDGSEADVDIADDGTLLEVSGDGPLGAPGFAPIEGILSYGDAVAIVEDELEMEVDVVEWSLEREDGGHEWDVTARDSEGTVWEFEIDANTGAVLEAEEA